jgi:hypothetical protein
MFSNPSGMMKHFLAPAQKLFAESHPTAHIRLDSVSGVMVRALATVRL